jgi:AraC-like DNA-binding protein
VHSLRAVESWTILPISRIEDLRDAVPGAGLEATQMSRATVGGSLAFARMDGIVYSSGLIGGTVALTGPLSEDKLTLGIGLHFGPGTRHWMEEVATGVAGAFHPGDEHDALYPPGSLYAAVTLTPARLEAEAARAGLVLDAKTLGGTRMHPRRVPPATVARLRRGMERVHAGAAPDPHVRSVGRELLAATIAHYAREPHPLAGRSDPQGYARIVARARLYIAEHLAEPISLEALAAAAFTSERTLHRAFLNVLGEPPQPYVRRLRLHRIRRDLAPGPEIACTVAIVANQWGIGELGRLAAWYRDLFGELPSETLARRRHDPGIAA